MLAKRLGRKKWLLVHFAKPLAFKLLLKGVPIPKRS
jgi:hypothetical protein